MPELRHVHVFDSRAAASYVTAENEVHYAPSRMRFVATLIKTCDRVAENLDARKRALPKKLPLMPVDLAATAAGRWLQALRASTTGVEMTKACEYSRAEDEERVGAEAALAQKDIAKRIQEIAREKSSLLKLRVTLDGIRHGLSEDSLTRVIQARKRAFQKRAVAREAAERVFAAAPLAGVGQATWMALWEQARKYSEEHAYPAAVFPNLADGARCVLCQQRLDGEGKTRAGHFEDFVTGGLEAAAKSAEAEASELLHKIPQVPDENEWSLRAALLKLDDTSSEELLKAFVARVNFARSALEVENFPAIDWTNIELAYSGVIATLSAEEASLTDLQKDGKRKETEARVLELRAKQWLHQNMGAIHEEIRRLRSLAALDKAANLTATNVLTKKNTELAKDELHAGYQERFIAELKALGGRRLPVVPQGKQAGKGKVLFGLSLQGVERRLPVKDVLSEGEARVVSLAAFLADIGGFGTPMPFIFDDPISSLDQDFEERVAARLIELSKSRQVIVFTHRLSLLALIDSEVRRAQDAARLQQIPSPLQLQVQSLTSFGKIAGVVQAVSVRDLKPKQALNRIQNEQLPQLRKAFEAGDVSIYDERANGICSEFRIVVERCVEYVLLNDVLSRFRRAVQTQGRIGALAKISQSDCGLIDDLMTRYSVFEHSQSEELPSLRPDIEVLAKDVANLASWVEEFGKRAVR